MGILDGDAMQDEVGITSSDTGTTEAGSAVKMGEVANGWPNAANPDPNAAAVKPYDWASAGGTDNIVGKGTEGLGHKAAFVLGEVPD